MSHSPNSAPPKDRGYYSYAIRCPKCEGCIVVRVPTGLIRPWPCPITPGCEQRFVQRPRQYGRPSYVEAVQKQKTVGTTPVQEAGQEQA